MELVLARRTSLARDCLRCQMNQVVADWAILHALKEESEASGPHQHCSSNAHRSGPCQNLPSLQHPVSHSRSGYAGHFLRWLCGRHAKWEAIWQLHAQLGSDLVSRKLEYNLTCPAHNRCFDVRELIPVRVELTACCVCFSLNYCRGKNACDETLHKFSVTPLGELFPERSCRCWHSLQNQEKHTHCQSKNPTFWSCTVYTRNEPLRSS